MAQTDVDRILRWCCRIVGCICWVVRDQPRTRALVHVALREVAAVARAASVDITEADVSAALSSLDESDPGTTASMMRDVYAGRPSELYDQTAVWSCTTGSCSAFPSPPTLLSTAHYYRANCGHAAIRQNRLGRRHHAVPAGARSGYLDREEIHSVQPGLLGMRRIGKVNENRWFARQSARSKSVLPAHAGMIRPSKSPICVNASAAAAPRSPRRSRVAGASAALCSTTNDYEGVIGRLWSRSRNPLGLRVICSPTSS
ncbi:ketopantoate reductase C-terminal domain-containing protein [Nocardia sp. KC 131]|uniref:ketopantoate reductase C-terminal domain-containing protein n=1 Tax=Nocardia arseniciresistens TaxID=3392119 RepID=UPI00398E8F00